MAVYVDTMRAAFGRMVMCHMIADSREELDTMADAIGVQRKWIQHAGTHLEHFDVSLTKKAAAIQRGAIEITMRELATKIRQRRTDEAGKERQKEGLDGNETKAWKIRLLP